MALQGVPASASMQRMPRLPVIAALLGLLTGPAAAEPVAYTLDPSHSFVTFELLHFDTATIRGRFGPLSGDVVLDRDARSGRVQLVINTAGVSTGLPVLDARIAQPDLLAVADHPQAFFVAEGFEFDARGLVAAVTGEFTLRGSSQALRLVAQRFRCYTHPLLRREVCGGDFEADFPRSAFGMTFGLPFVADTVRLKIQVETVRQTP
jgi:polyisoprenoid-binding protein YceI